MERFAICRICLSEEFELQYILDTHLEEVYESLTSKPFAIRDGRPLRACYVCRARLQYCYLLRRACLRSEELFAQLLNGDDIEPLRRAQQTSKTLTVTSVNNLCIGGVFPDSKGIKHEPIDIVADGETDVADEAGGLVPKHSVATTVFENVPSLIRSNDIPHVIVKTESLKAETSAPVFGEPGPSRTENTVDITPCKQEIIEEQYVVPVLNELTSNIDFVNSDDKNDVTSLLRVKKIQPQNSNRVRRSARKSRPYKATAPGVSKQGPHGGVTGAPVFEKPGTSRRKMNKITWCKQQMTKTNNPSWQSGKNKPTPKIDSTNSDDKYNVTPSLRGKAPRVYTRSAKTAKTHPCDFCQELFSTKSDLLKHVFLVHPYQPNDAPNTIVKDTSFLLTNGLTGVEPLQCNQCEKRFGCKRRLTMHLRVHDPDFSYQCNDCQKKFTTKASMKSHILRKHLGNKQCECRGCYKMYRSAAATNSNGSSSTRMRCCVTGQFL